MGSDTGFTDKYVISPCIGLHVKILVVERPTGVSSVRNCQNLSLCLTERMPGSSKVDPPLAKANNNGNTSVITNLRGEKRRCTTAVRNESNKNA